MDSSERSGGSNRERKPNGKTGEGASSALKEMVKRAALQPEAPSPPAAGIDRPDDPSHATPDWRKFGRAS